MTLEAHPAAAVWPMLPEPDLRRLADDIASNGQMYPIVLDAEGRVLDGRNRLAACRTRFEAWAEEELPSGAPDGTD